MSTNYIALTILTHFFFYFSFFSRLILLICTQYSIVFCFQCGRFSLNVDLTKDFLHLSLIEPIFFSCAENALLVIFGTNLHYFKCKFSIIFFKENMLELPLQKMLFGTNLASIFKSFYKPEFLQKKSAALIFDRFITMKSSLQSFLKRFLKTL